MARSGVQVDEVLQAPGLPEGEVHDRLLEAMAADDDYQAVQVSSDRFHFARTFRPTWAIVTACLTIWVAFIGIVFLFVKTTETCLAVIESDHRGVRVRLQGRISAAALGRLRAAMAGDAAFGPVGSVPQPAHMPGSPTAAVASAQRVGAPVASTFPVVENRGQMPSDPTAPAMQVPVAQPASPAPQAPAVPSPAPQAPAPQAPAPQVPAPQVEQARPAPSIAPVAGSGAPSASTGLPRPPSEPTSYHAPSRGPAADSPRHDDVVIPPPPPEPGRERPGHAPAVLAQPAGHNGTPPPLPSAVPASQTWVAPEQPGADSRVATDNNDDGDRTVVSGSGALGEEGFGAPARPRAVIDDGSVIDLAAITLIGRDPAAAEGEQALLVPIDDSTRSVSKTHLAIICTEGAWSIVDRNSTNGVSIVYADDEAKPLTPGVPLPAADGAVVRFGDRSLRLVETGVTLNGSVT